jgi:23S rRNA (cytosine1962-C5)-methyltransferase
VSVEQFANRLRKRNKHLGKWARRRGISCYRIYDKDLPDHPARLDRYGDDLVLWTFQRTRDETPLLRQAWEEELRAAVREVFPGVRIFQKQRQRQRTGEAGQYERQAKQGIGSTVSEGDARFELNLSDYLDVGLFIDHRPTRDQVAEAAHGKRLLNLFCYTGAFTVRARLAGAAASDSVDLSRTYLDWLRRNLALNDLADGAPHRLIRGDSLSFLEQAAAEGHRYDLVVCDPPTFSNSSDTAGTWDVLRDHPKLIGAIGKVLAPGGRCWFSTNARRFKLAELPGWQVDDITAKTLDEDMRDDKAHRCWLLRR